MTIIRVRTSFRFPQLQILNLSKADKRVSARFFYLQIIRINNHEHRNPNRPRVHGKREGYRPRGNDRDDLQCIGHSGTKKYQCRPRTSRRDQSEERRNRAWVLLEVVDSVSDSKRQIHVEKAGDYIDNPRLGQFVEKEIDPGALGRIAAQTAKQSIMQRIRLHEKERIHEDYKDQVGQVVSGIVRRREKGDLVVEVGKAEAILPNRERVPGEDYSPGEPIRCLF